MDYLLDLENLRTGEEKQKKWRKMKFVGKEKRQKRWNSGRWGGRFGYQNMRLSFLFPKIFRGAALKIRNFNKIPKSV